MLAITRLLVFILVLISGACGGEHAITNAGCPDPFIEAMDWMAVDNQEPPGRRFYVTGKVVVSTAGYSVTLKKRSPQGINPEVLLLDLEITRPTGMVAQVITTEEPRYEEDPYSGPHTSVGIYCGSDELASPTVRVVQ